MSTEYMTDKILPCKCGAAGVLRSFSSGQKVIYYLICLDCFDAPRANLHRYAYQAINEWNRKQK